MENPPRGANYNKNGLFRACFEIFGQGGCTFSNNRLVMLCLGLLNVILLITAVVTGNNCAKLRAHSLQDPDPAVTQLTDELNYLRCNYSDVIEATEEAKNELAVALKNHAHLKVNIELQKTINDNYQRQAEVLQTEKTNLRSNTTALEETCGRCLPRWILLNSSCYFFSYTKSSTDKRNWQDSREDCIRRGADLVVIDNQEEQKFVSNTIMNMTSGSDIWQNAFWLGITDKKREGIWVWINNVTEVEQRYWMDGEPNNAGHTGEDCGATIYSLNNPWKTRYDASCLYRQRYWICEMNSS